MNTDERRRPQMPRIRFGPRSQISPGSPAGSAAARLGVHDADLDAVERSAAAAVLVGRQVGVEPVTAVRAERLGHAEEVGARAGAGRRCGGSTAGRLASPSDDRSASAKDGCAASRAGLIGPAAEERDALAFEQLEGAGRFGLRLGEQRGAGHERAEEPAAEAARPEEGHRDVEPLTRPNAASLQGWPRWPAARRRGCG